MKPRTNVLPFKPTPPTSGRPPTVFDLERAVADLERDYISRALLATDSLYAAACWLGLRDETALCFIIHRHPDICRALAGEGGER